MSPAGLISNTALRTATDGTGVFGVVLGGSSGTVTITSVNSSTAPVSTSVTNGSLFIPSLATTRGRFNAVFTGTDGQSFSKQFNKDASDYFLLLLALQPSSVVSRKVHGRAGQFDIAVPLTGNPGIECGSGGTTNFREDVLADCAITNRDAGMVKAGSGDAVALINRYFR